MNQWIESFGEAESAVIAALVDQLSAVAGMQVACIGFVDEEYHLALSYCPGFERSVLQYMARVNWSSALRLVEEHTE
jgi:hypothetical protein